MIAGMPASGRHVPFQQGSRLEDEVDWVVVGSGAGGAAAAVVLARAGYSVAVCESGPWREPRDYPSSSYGAIRDLFDAWGNLFSRGESMIPILQASCVGGTTVINSAIVVRTPGDVLAEWAAMGLGEVFHEDSIGTAQDEIEAELEVGPMGGRQFGRNDTLLLSALASRGREGKATLRAARDCCGSGQCLQGCRAGTKQSTNLNWIPEVLARGGTVLSSAPVARVAIERGRATGVEGRFVHPVRHLRRTHRGATFRVRARRGVLVAASATGSPVLLARSGIRLPALGRFFRGHPGAGIVAIYPEEVRMDRGTTQGVASLAYRESHRFKVESLTLPLDFLAPRLPGAGRSMARWIDRIPNLSMWVAVVRAEAEGTVRPGRRGGIVVRYRPTRGDLERGRRGVAERARLHFAAGATEILPGIHGLPASLGPDEVGRLEEAPLDNRAWTWVMTHLFGGCVLGADPGRSVVGPDLEVRGVRGLSVVDASALPTTLGVNPQHTIMAVARVVAGRLANQEVPTPCRA